MYTDETGVCVYVCSLWSIRRFTGFIAATDKQGEKYTKMQHSIEYEHLIVIPFCVLKELTVT